ncbi:hypothetical protein KL86DPRO_40006 [uncultured delta proteobacterium]|uniref:Uncharacterized protein n=1 Tax=uncultured delta proteobacterium TaxID=34034 RepID=A0A212K8L7_9DELT|nr:hypothetical protein KL86DPRO_40006 [uncultured delta proteobacterium]
MLTLLPHFFHHIDYILLGFQPQAFRLAFEIFSYLGESQFCGIFHDNSPVILIKHNLIALANLEFFTDFKGESNLSASGNLCQFHVLPPYGILFSR